MPKVTFRVPKVSTIISPQDLVDGFSIVRTEFILLAEFWKTMTLSMDAKLTKLPEGRMLLTRAEEYSFLTRMKTSADKRG